jgi:ABC-type Fe3+-hydroxamate transport system substrate-binding protein
MTDSSDRPRAPRAGRPSEPLGEPPTDRAPRAGRPSEPFKGRSYAQISAERLDLLDAADVLIPVATRKPQLARTTGARTYKRLRAVREGRVVHIDDPDLAIAMSYTSLLSIPYQLREVVPGLRDALSA